MRSQGQKGKMSEHVGLLGSVTVPHRPRPVACAGSSLHGAPVCKEPSWFTPRSGSAGLRGLMPQLLVPLATVTQRRYSRAPHVSRLHILPWPAHDLAQQMALMLQRKNESSSTHPGFFFKALVWSDIGRLALIAVPDSQIPLGDQTSSFKPNADILDNRPSLENPCSFHSHLRV